MPAVGMKSDGRRMPSQDALPLPGYREGSSSAPQTENPTTKQFCGGGGGGGERAAGEGALTVV